MLTHLSRFAGPTAHKTPSSSDLSLSKVTSSNRNSHCSVDSVSQFLDGEEYPAANGELETLHERSDSKDEPSLSSSGGFRPNSLYTVNSNSTTLSASTSTGGITAQDDERTCKTLVVSADYDPPPRTVSLIPKLTQPIARSYSVTDVHNRARVGPVPSKLIRSKSNCTMGLQVQFVDQQQQRCLESDPSQKYTDSPHRTFRSAKSPSQRPVAPAQSFLPRKLRLSSGSSSQAALRERRSASYTLPCPPSAPSAQHRDHAAETSNPVKWPTSGPCRSETAPNPSTDLESPVRKQLVSFSLSRRDSKIDKSAETLQPTLPALQTTGSQPKPPPVQNPSTSSTSHKPSKLTFKAFLESKPALQTLIQSDQQKQTSRTDSVSSNSLRSSMQSLVGSKRKSTIPRVEVEKAAPGPVLIRKETPEELLKHLIRLVGYDALRLLVADDQRLLQAKDGGGDPPTQYPPHSNRKLIGNGILGRFGWRHKKAAPTQYLEKKPPANRNETTHKDRRATFGFWGCGSMRVEGVGVFGCPLEDSDPFSCVTVIGGQKHLIPTVMFCLIEEIFSRGMATPGFMRIAGKIEQVDALAEAFERPPYYGDGTDLGSEDIHVLCSLFKRYLRALPEPLMPRDLFHVFWSHCVRQRKGLGEVDLKNKVSTAQCLMRLMPERSFSLLIYVVAFLAQIHLFPRNKFSSTGIAKIFGPALFGTRTQRNGASDERPIQGLKWMLENWIMVTDGLMDEHYAPKDPVVPSPPTLQVEHAFPTQPTPPSSQDTSARRQVPRHLSQPTLPNPQDLTTTTRRQDLQSAALRPPRAQSIAGSTISKSLSLNIKRANTLRGYHSQQLRRNSLRSAQYIVDCYEAYDKNVTDVQSLARSIDGADRLLEEDDAKVPMLAKSSDGIANVTEISPDEQTALQGERTYTYPFELHDGSVGDHSKRDNFNQRSLRGSFKRQLLVLNEPLDSAPVKLIITEPAVSESGDNSPVYTSEPAATSDTSSGKSDHQGDTAPGENTTTQCAGQLQPANDSPHVFTLGGLFPMEKFELPTNVDRSVDEDRAKRVIQKSIEIVDKHQQLLLELKEQLYSMLTEDRKNIRLSSRSSSNR